MKNLNNFTSNSEEEIKAMINMTHWLNKFEEEFNIPRHYKYYLTNAISRLELMQTVANNRIPSLPKETK